MNYLISKEDSLLKLNKEELEIKQPKKRQTNSNLYKILIPEGEPVSKKLKKSITKFQRKKTTEQNKSKDFSKKQVIQKKFTAKVPTHKKMITKQKYFSNRSLHARINIQDEEKNIKKTINHINSRKEEKINLKQI